MNKRRRSAVTLLELMVVLAIVVIISAISIPSIVCFGRFPTGMMARLKPSFAASRSRSCPRCTGRISPANPTSPNTIDLSFNALFFMDE